ncbi:MAG: hypothetical protein A2516_11065 [Alphaproteobacteria bacterium RIFOXYD12_FULL_60_8]|nr:MAG: hypothetical protein A2516_11065 [Alphaproteobacteria bacterium RIFOXYD12_FULL_60_8]
MTATEIYLCKPGQALKEGRIEMSHDINDKEDAKADAERRCKYDTSTERIAYYHVSESGSFRCIYTHTNPNAGKAPPKSSAFDDPKPKKKAPPRKKTAWEKFLSALGLK